MDKMVIFRTDYRNTRNGSRYSAYTVIRCSYPLYLTTLNTSNSPLSYVYSKNNNNNTYLKYSSATEQLGSTSVRLGQFVNSTSCPLPGVIPSFNQALITPDNPLEVIYSDVDIYIDDEIFYQNYIPPSLNNAQTDLENLSFPAFIINANSFTQDMINDPYKPLVMLFYNRSLSNSSTTDGLYPIKEKYFYKQSIFFDADNSTDENYIFKYPIFKTGILFNVGSTYEIRFATTTYNEEFDTTVYEYLGDPYVFTIHSDVTQDYINQLNQQTALSTDEDSTNEQINAINQQTQSIDNINNSITDSNIDSSSIDLPTDNTQDPTQARGR